MATQVLPSHYFYFFWLVEPILTIAGAGYAIFLPDKYANDLIPPGYDAVSMIMKRTVREHMLVGNLGSCFFLLALISLSLFPIFRSLSHLPRLQERLVEGLLIPLAVADIIHIVLTLLPLPPTLRLHPSKWNTLIWGNVGITFILFIVRGLWFAGQYRLAFDDDASDVDEQPQTLREILEEVSKGKSKVVKGMKSE